MRVVAALLFVLLASAAALDIAYSGNVSVSGDEDNWKFRRTSFTYWDLDPLDGDGISFNSLSLGRTKASIHGDAVWGKVEIWSNTVPTAWLKYASTAGYNESNEYTGAASWGVVANAYLLLEETAPNGTVVRVQSLREQVFGDFGWDTNELQTTGSLKYASYLGKKTSENWEIEITFLLSEIKGKVSLADAVVVPKSLESVVSIKNWPYKDAANTLSLVIVVATGSFTAKGSAIVSGSNEDDQVYFALSTKATVGGKVEDVSVSGYSNAEFDASFSNDNIKAELTGVYGANYQVKQVKVTFPAGAQDILYDPTIGAGATAAIDNASSAVVANLVVLTVVALVSLLL